MKLLPDIVEAVVEASLTNKTGITAVATEKVEIDEWDMPVFAFHELDYIPSGYGGILAPYIETGPGSKCSSLLTAWCWI